jgi:predicted MPP superfamily phosphohydrolase
MKPSILLVVGIFLAAYGGMHVFIFQKLGAFPAIASLPTAITLAGLALSPLLVALLARAGFTRFATPLAWITYIWMGYAFLFFCAALLLDAWQWTIMLTRHLSGADTTALTVPARYAVTCAATVALAVTLYGVHSADHIGAVTIQIATPKFDAGAAPLRIVQISDLHLGLLTRESQVRRLIAEIKALDPDIIVSTGDIIDMQPDHVDRFADALSELQPRLGKFAINGNHEHFAGIAEAEAFATRAGFHVLSSTAVTVENRITIVGVDDGTPPHSNGHLGEAGILAAYRNDTFLLLLKHQPVVDPAAAERFDLQLSGHTHGGQIFPFHLLTRLAYHVAPGLTRAGTHAWLYTSCGTGTWGPPLRVLAPPEVTIIDLIAGTNPPVVTRAS